MLQMCSVWEEREDNDDEELMRKKNGKVLEKTREQEAEDGKVN